MSKIGFALLVSLGFFSLSSLAVDSAELISLRDEYQKTCLKKSRVVLSAYLKELKALEKKLLQKHDVEGALFVQKECVYTEKRMQNQAQLRKTHGEPSELRELRYKCEQKIIKRTKPIRSRYISNLEELEEKLLKRKDARGTLAVQQELETVKNQERQGLTHIKTYSDTHRGGATSRPSNNSYCIPVDRIGSKSILKTFIHGLNGTNSHGEITIKTPKGKTSLVAKWSPSTLAGLPTDINVSYQALTPAEYNISRFMDTPGDYHVTFKYTGGGHGLIIKRVEIATH